jgi:hypothetical protein
MMIRILPYHHDAAFYNIRTEHFYTDIIGNDLYMYVYYK